ncbi:MAG TPA: RtcB family protein, partial [Thermomicrobiaceae bacterium]|nr:RtcB family protein [Thermomicrobiaceae bacterium]
EEKTLEQFKAVAEDASRAALMADGHFGYIMPVGAVAAYEDRISVHGVGYDIGCGNTAIQTGRRLAELTPDELSELADTIANEISFGLGRTNKADDAPVDDPLFEDDAWNAIPDSLRESLREKARGQLGTVGGGNHYVDVFVDDAGFLWVGVHFGSRGLGHTIASGFLAESQGMPWGTRVPERPAFVGVDEPIGERYWRAMTLAGGYASAGRDYVAYKTASLIGGEIQQVVRNHHNYCWIERHDGYDYYVVRKGCTPAFPGQLSFIGGSMGDDAYIVEGARADTEAQRNALYSTVHGAGRVMSRTRAKGRRGRKGEPKTRGEVTRQMMSEWTKRKGVIVRGGDVDESPHVYRRLDEVIAAQGDTIQVLHTLTPIIVAMAGADVRDPYKD